MPWIGRNIDDKMGQLVTNEKKKLDLKRWNMLWLGLMAALEKATNSEVQKKLEDRLMAHFDNMPAE